MTEIDEKNIKDLVNKAIDNGFGEKSFLGEDEYIRFFTLAVDASLSPAVKFICYNKKTGHITNVQVLSYIELYYNEEFKAAVFKGFENFIRFEKEHPEEYKKLFSLTGSFNRTDAFMLASDK